MRGHEYVRDALCNYLAGAVPLLLAAHLADIGQTDPDPSEVRFVLADSLQDVVETESEGPYPVVAVRSSDAEDSQNLGGGLWAFTYDLEVMVACDHRVYGPQGYRRATRARDRLLLAVRESLLTVRGMASADPDGDISFLPGKRREQTGRGNQQTLSGVALAVGTVDLRARVTESLAPVAAEQIEAIDLTVSGLDAAETLPA